MYFSTIFTFLRFSCIINDKYIKILTYYIFFHYFENYLSNVVEKKKEEVKPMKPIVRNNREG